ncbi:MAG: response regulator [Fibrobacter sp.]|nr:response regulator [Fibrobacter sp.]
MKFSLGKNNSSAKKENVTNERYKLSFSLGREFHSLINEILATNALILKGVDDPMMKLYATRIQNTSRGLMNVVDDVMDFSSIESGELKIAPVNYNLFLVLNDCYEMFFRRAQENNIKFIFDIDANTPIELYGDEKRIHHILTSLLYYSLKYTMQGQVSLKVSFERVGGADSENVNLILEVRDSGGGIPQFAMDSLFDISDRIGAGNDVDGVDLCLNLSKRLVEMFGGSFDVKSEVGSGTTCSMRIPQMVKRNVTMGDFLERRKTHSRSLEVVKERFCAPNAEILIADGLPLNLRIMKNVLAASGIRIDTADDGMEALEKIKRKHYDAILLDQELSVMTAGEVMEMMQTLSEIPNAKTPVVLMLSVNQVVVKEVYEKMGFADCLQKPVQEDSLLVLLNNLLPSNLVESKHVSAPKAQPSKPTKEKKSEQAQPEKESVNFLDVVKDFNVPSDLLKLSATKFVDVHVGLNFCQNDDDLYRTMLMDFRRLNRENSIQAAMDNGDFEVYRIEVRSLKSAALAIGAIDVASRAKAMEYACKDGKFEYVKMHHENFIREYKNLMNVLGDML